MISGALTAASGVITLYQLIGRRQRRKHRPIYGRLPRLPTISLMRTSSTPLQAITSTLQPILSTSRFRNSTGQRPRRKHCIPKRGTQNHANCQNSASTYR